jgi:hypothetical protein
MRADGIEESTMPKKDTAATVAAMLSSAGAQTRRMPERAESVAPVAVPPMAPPAPSVTVTEPPQATVSTLPTPIPPAPAAPPVPEAPRTLRLQPATAKRLRDAWLEAKRDDVLLTAQDFASELLDEALTRRGRSRVLS